MTFGSYSLASIGLALISFGNCEEAAVELAKVKGLIQEIQTAKMQLRSKGVTID